MLFNDMEKLAKIGDFKYLLHIAVDAGNGETFFGNVHLVTQHQQHAQCRAIQIVDFGKINNNLRNPVSFAKGSTA